MRYVSGSANLKDWVFLEWGDLNAQVSEACTEAFNNTMRDTTGVFADLEIQDDGSLVMCLALRAADEDIDEEPTFRVSFEELLRDRCSTEMCETKEEAFAFLAMLQSSIDKVRAEVKAQPE